MTSQGPARALRRFFATATSLAVIAGLLAGCSTPSTVLATQGVAEADAGASAELAKARYVAPNAPSGPLRERNGMFLAGQASANAHGGGLPAKYRKSYVFVSASPLDLHGVSALITRETGISVLERSGGLAVASQGADWNASADLTRVRLAAGPMPANFDAEKALASANGSVGLQPALAESSSGTMPVNYTGRLDAFLDLVGDAFNMGWVYEDGRVIFSRTQTATFDIPALPIVMKLAFSLDSGAQTSGGSGGATSGGVQQTGGSDQKASTEAAFSLWTEIEKTLKSIVGSDGSVDISGSTGTVTVVAPAPSVRQVKNYVRRINQELSRQIVLGVDVYSVTLSKGDNYNVNLNLAFAEGTKWGAGAASAGSAAGITTVSGLLSQGTANNSIGFAVLDPNSKFNGTNGLIQALSTQGDVSVVNSTSLTTLNGIPAPFQVVNTRGYVAQVSTTTTSSSGASTGSVQTSLTPGSVTTGFNLYVVPRVDRNGTVLLQYGVNMSELVGAQNGFDTFSSGGQTVQLPNINARNFVQEASVPVNGTLVLTGFESKADKINDQGTGTPGFWLLGGQKVNSHSRTVIVISITPRIIAFGQKNAVD